MSQRSRSALVTVGLAVVVAALLTAAISDGGARAGGIPVVWWCAAVAFGVNWVAYIPSAIARTERFYDLVGSVAHLATVATALVLTPDIGGRSWLLGALVGAWALRLGAFLYRRVRRAGHDRRFDRLKTDPIQYLMTWTLQGLWITATQAAALAAITAGEDRLGAAAALGAAIWLIGFGIEVVADAQKSRFRSDPANREQFISTGLWARSRHPNYFGEIVLWIGVTVIALPTLGGWRWFALTSPLFVYALLTRGSGIPLLEARAATTWGDDPTYQRYTASTPTLIHRTPTLRRSTRR